ncbi:MAG: acyltransferase [Acetobacteraceae bacterium]|nr:acyltransferase [Acetobacteraceae bacterium]
MSQATTASGRPVAPAGTPPAARPRARRLDLDRAKGIAILLVVLGHIVARDQPPGLEWYEPFRYAIYRFHMPFFLYLSGTVVVLTGLHRAAPADWPGVLRGRAVRLLVPFFGLGLFILAAKLAAMQVVHVDNRPEGLWTGLRDLFWTTGQSPAVTVWYLFVLFLSTVLAVPLLRLGIGTTGLVALGVVLQTIEVPPVAYLDRLASHFVFFAAGAWVAERQDRLLPLFERLQPLWWAAFAAAIGLAVSGWMGERAALFACGLLCIPALHGLIRLPPVSGWRWPLFLGRYAMAVYLFNTLAIGFAKALLIAAGVAWTKDAFPVHVVVLTAAGLALPILVKALLLRRLPPIDRLTD